MFISYFCIKEMKLSSKVDQALFSTYIIKEISAATENGTVF